MMVAEWAAKIAAENKPVTLHHLEPDTLFRDRDSLWKVCETDDETFKNGNILATRIASWNVNNTGEMTTCERGIENYNAYNEVRLVGGIYEVTSHSFRSPLMKKD